MDSIRSQNTQAALMSLETAAATARAGFACLFSSSDEYETALIAERRAEGRYGQQTSRRPTVILVVCLLTIVGAVLLLA